MKLVHISGCNANVSLFKSWFRVPGNTTEMDFIKKQGANLASWKVSVATRLSFPGGFIFTIPASFHFCSVGTQAKRCCWKRILCFKNEDKILWQAAKDYLLMSEALQRIWSSSITSMPCTAMECFSFQVGCCHLAFPGMLFLLSQACTSMRGLQKFSLQCCCC